MVTYRLEVLYPDVAQVQHEGIHSFGSGRLIGRNLILTARHVVTAKDATAPTLEGWHVRLFATKPTDGADWKWLNAEVTWTSSRGLDLALLTIRPEDTTVHLRPRLKFRTAKVERATDYRVFGLGFPLGASVDHKRQLMRPSGSLFDEGRETLTWGIDSQYVPEAPDKDWPGFSGAAVFLAETDDQSVIWIYGVATHIPPKFKRQFDVARLERALQETDFCEVLRAAEVSPEPAFDPTEYGALGTSKPGEGLTLGPASGRIKINLTGAAANKYTENIQAFFDEYLISETAPGPVLFGGRDKGLAYLDSWLASEVAPSRLVLAGPGGRGKSALLVHWIERLSAQRQIGGADDQWRLFFVPISMRINTTFPRVFYEAIAAQLADILGRDLDHPQTDHAAYYEDRCRSLLVLASNRKIRILLVVDGLDEAWGGRFSGRWFPRNIGSNLRILVAARLEAGDQDAQGWVKRLGWDSDVRTQPWDLPELDFQGVEDLLRKGGTLVEAFATRPEIKQKLHELTQGEPLLLKFYIEDLRQETENTGGLRVENLDQMKPGWKGYFEDWLRRQHEVWEAEGKSEADIEKALWFLATFACSYGPLTANDLRELAHSCGIKLGFRIRDALDPIRRFVFRVGNISPKEGSAYVLTHLRFGEFLRDEYFVDDPQPMQRIRNAFVAWGHDVLHRLNTGGLQPDRVPAYLLRYLGQHLEDLADDPEAGRVTETREIQSGTVFPLISEGWLRAWEALDISSSGFLADVDRAWHQADQIIQKASSESAVAQALVLQIKCALCRASVVSLSANTPAELLAEALKADIFSPSQCMEILSKIIDHEERAQALIKLSPLLPEPQLRQAFGMAQKIRGISVTDHIVKARTLAEIARYLPDHEKGSAVSQALEELRVPQAAPFIEWERIRLLADLAERLPRAAKDATLAQALLAARVVSDEQQRVRALTDVAEHLGMDERHTILTEALGVARAISEPRERATALIEVAEQLTDSEKTSTMSEALGAARDIPDLLYRAAALARVSGYLPEPNRSQVETEALEAVRATEDKIGRALYLARFLAPRMTGSQKRVALAEAAELSSEIKDPISRAQVLTELGIHSTGAARHAALDEALDAARAAEGPSARAWLLTELAVHLDEPLKSQALREALKAARAIADHKELSAALAQLASHLARQSAAKLIDRALTELVNAIKQYREVRIVRGRTGMAIVDEASIDQILRALIPRLTNDQKTQILELVASIPNESERTKSLVALVPQLSQSQKAQLLAVARLITNQSERAQVLIGLGTCVPEPLQRALLDAVQEIELHKERAEALSQLAVHLVEPLAGDAWSEALSAARLIDDEAERARVLTSLVTHLAEPLRGAAVQEALDAADQIHHQSVRAGALIRLIPYVAEPTKSEIIDKVLTAAVFITEDWAERGDVIATLGPHLTGAVAERALTVIRQMKGHHTRTTAIFGLAPYLDAKLMGEALDLARQVEDEWYRAQILGCLASNTRSTSVTDKVLEAARNIQSERAQVEVLTSVAEHLPEPRRTAVLEEAVNAARRVRDENARADALISAASHLPETLKDILLREAFTTARNACDHWSRQRTLMDLAPQLQDTDRTVALREALEAARRGADKGTLKALAPHLPEPERSEILYDLLTEARTFSNDVFQARKVVEISKLLTTCVTSRPSSISSHWSEVLRILSSHSRPNFLNNLTRVLPLALALAGEAADEQVILGTFNAIQDVSRWWP
jgi:hypothetical protein